MATSKRSSDGIFVKFLGTACDGSKVAAAASAAFGPTSAQSNVNLARGYAILYFEQSAAVGKALEKGVLLVDGVTLPIEKLKPVEDKPAREGARPPRAPKASGTAGAAGAAARPTAEDPMSIYVSGLPETFEKPALRALFGKFGEVKSLEVRKRKQKEGVSTHVFMSFSTQAAADAAVAASPVALAGVSLAVERRKSPRAAPAAPKPAAAPSAAKSKGNGPSMTKNNNSSSSGGGAQHNKVVYLSNIAHTVGEGELKTLFARFGTVEGVSLRTRDCFCSLEFEDKASMDKAAAAYKAKPAVFLGTTLVVEPWKSSRSDESLSKTLHVSGFGAQVPDEAGLKKAMGAVPAFTATIKPMRKFALVTFGDAEAASKAVEAAKAGSVPVPVQAGETLLAELSDESRKRNSRYRGNGAKRA
jgi:RNA recognition motif-containing protein